MGHVRFAFDSVQYRIRVRLHFAFRRYHTSMMSWLPLKPEFLHFLGYEFGEQVEMVHICALLCIHYCITALNVQCQFHLAIF